LKPVAGAVSGYLLHAAGLGKTTIAHVVARHCGYRPFEINASDDRTATALQSRIQDAVQMQSVLGKRQMNLVIVDEVDGIAGDPSLLFPAALTLLFALDCYSVSQPVHKPFLTHLLTTCSSMPYGATWICSTIVLIVSGLGFPCCFEPLCLVVMKFVWVCRGE